MSWKWSNVPIPDGHVFFLVVGVILHSYKPWKLFQENGVGLSIGWAMIVVGALVAAWAVTTFADMNTKKPTKLVSTGPYAFSRNPMYVAWTSIYIGVNLILNTVWMLAFLPVVLIGTHYLAVMREERFLKREFGDEYTKYKEKVRRYL
jgi:protein-S-isoprenylcysteine O-methyltransferase Ste14